MDMLCSLLAFDDIKKIKSISASKIVFKDGAEMDAVHWLPQETRFEEEMVRNIVHNLLRVMAKAKADIHGTIFEEELDTLTERFKLTYARSPEYVKELNLNRTVTNSSTKSEMPT